MELATAAVLAGAGMLAGAVNAMAGGGTFFTFPVLIWAGLPPMVANITNMVALLPANLAALPAFRAELAALGRRSLLPLVISVVGGTFGALLLLWLGAAAFAAAVPYLIAFATLLFAAAPRLRRHVQGLTAGQAVPAAVLLLFSVYGGYFGAGLGQITLAALILAGFGSLHEANALKNAMVFAVSLMAVMIFGLSGQVAWGHALVMMLSSAAGGYLGGVLSLLLSPSLLRGGIIAFGSFLSLYYLTAGA
ncbi:sulfite exporter TauE/SafE family protein [Leisingera sp. D0M16]|uniref:sulfite exporter TauE/SafE family protein n=1 Tax=Leisingera coralii TaxID=3351347 RepID=UPI003B8260D3